MDWHRNHDDRTTARRWRDGDITINARLDLHGYTQVAAHKALKHFMDQAVASHARTLLIITGKGAHGQGILRQNLSLWLEALPTAPSIRRIRPAAMRHGGEGAFYIELRRPKPTQDR